MPSLFKIAAAVAVALVGQAAAAPAPSQSSTPQGFMKVLAQPNNFVIGKNNTFKSTSEHTNGKAVADNAPATPLALTFTSSYSGPASPSGDGNTYAYVTGLDGDGAAFFLLPNGTPYYPPNPAAGGPPTPVAQDVSIPIGGNGASANVNLPNYISSGRIYFSVGKMSFGVNNGPNGAVIVAPSFENPSDPNIDINYGFTEFTWNAEEIYSNLSYVDFVGLVASQQLQGSQGTCSVSGLPGTAVSTICSGLSAQGQKDGQAWSKSCQADQSGNLLRVLAPLHLVEVDSGALSGYYDSYIDAVWSQYTSNPLTITGDSLGTYTGQVDSGSGMLVFENGGPSYAKPALADILGCNSGPFANPAGGTEAELVIVPRLCAAFYRSTLLLAGGNQQPDGVAESDYYPTNEPTSWYARLVHEAETDARGYAFSYDDVIPSGGVDSSGACVDAAPTHLSFTVGA